MITGEEWIGKFDFGIGINSKVEIINDHISIILSKGNIYVFDFILKKIEHCFKNSNYENFAIDHLNKMIILTNGLNITVYDFNYSFINKTNRISIDGIQFDYIKDNILYGKLNDLTIKWCDFEYHIIENKIISAWNFEDSIIIKKSPLNYLINIYKLIFKFIKIYILRSTNEL